MFNDYLIFISIRSVGLSSDIDSTGSIAAIEAAIERLNRQRNELEEIWAMRKMKLELYLRLRVFERDALEVSEANAAECGWPPRDVSSTA